jgi:S1-C subfamily serine protease
MIMIMGKAKLLSIGCVLVALCGAAVAQSQPLTSREAGLATLDFRQVVADAKDKVFPAVVFIKCLKETHESGKKVTEEVVGSGVIVTDDGQVLTNWHVVDKVVEVRCLLYDGRAMDAHVVGSDKDSDLALVQLKVPPGGGPLPHAELGDSTKLKEGDFVMAMGAPWGLNRSVSIGIISCTRRFLPDYSQYSLWLQTDASISPGNSGGPLVNTDGQIVGINALAVMRGGDMGFAIPSETITVILPQLRTSGKVDWSWTGLQLQPLKDFNKNIYFDATEGVIVAETDPESPARRAGIQPTDRIIRVNGEPLTAEREEDLPAVRRWLGLLPKHAPASFEIVRGGQTLTLQITPREKGKVEGEELDCPRWNLTLKTINQFDNPDLYFHRTQGVFVYGVKYPGNAANAGLEAQDIVMQIDGKEIVTLDDARAVYDEAVANVATKHRAVFTILRNGLTRQLVLDFSRDYEKE